MSRSTVLTSVRRLRHLLAAQQGQEQSDEQLLTAFAERRDDLAFAALVRRHGPMVVGVCRRVLGHEQDSEDAFQAVFLVLAQQAASLRNKSALASFLHGAAFHIASKMKRAAARRHKHESRSRASAGSDVNPIGDLLWREVRALLDDEIARLPEKYQNVFILCCIEEMSQAKAAQRLGLKVRTVSNHLAEARKPLGQRLARRGVELTAALAATAVVTPQLSAVPAGLLSHTIETAVAITAGEKLASLVSATVAELAEGMATAVMLSKAKMAMLLLASATLLAGVGVWACHTPALTQPDERCGVSPPVSTSTGGPTPHRSSDTAKAIKIQGRVFGPEGKPFKGARLYWPRMPKAEARTMEDIENIEIPQRAKSDAEGRFHFELPRSDIKPEWNLSLVAAADGYGVAWANWSAIEAGGELTLRLVKDQPIEGRIINTEGKPQAGVRVSIISMGEPIDGKLNSFLVAWQRDWQWAQHRTMRRMFGPFDQSVNTTTAKDGSFRITGAGSERLVELMLRDPGTVQGRLCVHVINRAGVDVAAVNKAVLDRIPVELRSPGNPPLLYGPKFTYVRPPSRRIEGTVREAGSGKPVAGYSIGSVIGWEFGIDAVSDKEGRYKLDGVPKVKEYLLSAEPPSNTSWLQTGARLSDSEGVQPLTVDFTVARGILVTGRIHDKKTDKGVKGNIRYVPLLDNKFADKPGYDAYKYDRSSREVDAGGRFKLRVIPGPGILIVQAQGGEKANGGQEINPYIQAEIDAKNCEQLKIIENEAGSTFLAADKTYETLTGVHAFKVLDLDADAGAAACDLFVSRGATQVIKIEDDNGKALSGTEAVGVTAEWWPPTISIKESVCTVFTLDPKKPRRVIFYHDRRRLAASLMLRGDEKGPLTVRLVPTGSVTGRLLDRDGQPIAGADIDVSSPDRSADKLYHDRYRKQLIRSDKDGRFRIDGIVPDVKFMLSIYQGKRSLVGEPRIGARQVESSQTLDFGSLRVKPAP